MLQSKRKGNLKFMGTNALIKYASKGCLNQDEAINAVSVLKNRIPGCKMYFDILVTVDNHVVGERYKTH